MIISFCFTIKILNSPKNLDRYVEMISKAVECAKQHHKVKFYTDVETLPFIPINGIELQLVNTDNFYFVDDFKVYLLDKLKEDEILVDTDLFLFAPLKLDLDNDLYVDFKDDSTKKWYSEYLDWFVENGVRDIIPTFNKEIINPPNIGILKIKNDKLLKEYTELYYKIRQWVLEKDNSIHKGVSIILGQYLLGMVCREYKVQYCYTKKNHYVHLSGPSKFKEGILKNIIPNTKQKLI